MTQTFSQLVNTKEVIASIQNTMTHFYKTNVAYLQVLLIYRGNGVRIGTENF